MSLKVKLTIEKTDLLFQEDTALEITITNQAPTLVNALSPANCKRLPVLIVTNVETGAQETFQREVTLFTREHAVPLGPGKSETGQMNLSTIASLTRAGTYDLVAQWDWDDGAGRAQSEPVRVTVREVRPRALSLASLAGGPGNGYLGAWVNLAAQPPALCVSWFDVGRKPRVVKTRVLGPIAAQATPQISAPVNGQLMSDFWLAWFEGDTLRIARTSENIEGPPALTNQLALAALPKELVGPLNCVAGARGAEGRFFLWQGNNEGTISRFQTVHLDAKGNAEAGGNAILAGSRPVWTQAAFLSNMTSRTYALTQDGAQINLQAATWNAQSEAAKTQALGRWDGEFLAAGAVLAADDAVYGALLALEPGAQNSRRLLLHSWRHDAGGAFDEGAELDLKRGPEERVAAACAGSGIYGEPVALVRMKDGMWEAYREETGRKLIMDPKAIADSPVNLIFPNSTDPVVQYCDPGRGFYFLTFEGRPAGPPPSG